MTRVYSLQTSLKTLDITYRTPQETLLSTPEPLPTSEPSTPQIRYTVTASDLPTLSIGVRRVIYVAAVYGAGRFTTAGTVYWRMRRNGASVSSSSSSVSANNFYTISAFFYDITVGDVLELSLWSSVSDSNWDYSAFQVQVTRVIPFDRLRLLSPCNFAIVQPQPVLTLGSPSAYSTTAYNPCHDDRVLSAATGAVNYTSIYVGSTSGLFRIGRGDYYSLNSAISAGHSTSRPYYYRNHAPARIVFRALDIDKFY